MLNNHMTGTSEIGPSAGRESASAINLAIIIFVLFAIKNATDAAYGSKIMILVVLADFAIAWGLYTRKQKYINLAIWRAIGGGILWPLLTVLQSGVVLGIIVGLTEWGFSGSILLLLLGKPTLWRQAAGLMTFTFFTLSIFLYTMLAG